MDENKSLLARILSDRPQFHSGDPELPSGASLGLGETILPLSFLEQVQSGAQTCLAPGSEVLMHLFDLLAPNACTLETGAGLSTLVFALSGAQHTCITPNESEVDAIRSYAESQSIDLGNTRFIVDSSDRCLPREQLPPLDLVLIDGKHAFPWPTIDWFYSSEALVPGGVMVVDDGNIPSVGYLCQFMREDPRWSLLKHFDETTFFFRKEADDLGNVAWHMQPWVTRRYRPRTAIKRLVWQLRWLRRYFGRSN